ncbi:MAG: hypothetical protein AAGI38_10245 [Bacteroidota bacterium]
MTPEELQQLSSEDLDRREKAHIIGTIGSAGLALLLLGFAIHNFTIGEEYLPIGVIGLSSLSIVLWYMEALKKIKAEKNRRSGT